MRNLTFILLIATLFYTCGVEDKPNYLKFGNKDEIQRFRIDQTADVVIEGTKGTLLQFQRNSFVDNEGNAVRFVEILLREFYSPKDFVFNRLSTMTNDGRLLRSSGMIQVQASSEGEEAYLKEGATVKLGFPRVQKSRVANLFLGREGTNAEIVWDVLPPVHIDTSVYRTEVIEMLAYGREKVTIGLFAVVVNDTIIINSDNYEEFERFPQILIGSNRYRREYANEDTTFATTLYFDKDRYYIFETSELGFVNCDIFVNEELFPFMVKTDKSNSDVFIVLNGMNSVIYPDSTSQDRMNYFFRLPDDIPISVAAYSKEKDVHLFDLVTASSSLQAIELALKPAKLEEIDEVIEQLD